MPWFEYNLHLRHSAFNVKQDYIPIRDGVLDFVKPFITEYRCLFSHWHYLFEVDQCREKQIEIRLRFESSADNILELKENLINELDSFVNDSNILMKESEVLGSHEGAHGNRGGTYLGAESEGFGADWPKIKEIFQIGSENALKILTLGRELVTPVSLNWGGRQTYRPYYLHLPANQLFVEP